MHRIVRTCVGGFSNPNADLSDGASCRWVMVTTQIRSAWLGRLRDQWRHTPRARSRLRPRARHGPGRPGGERLPLASDVRPRRDGAARWRAAASSGERGRCEVRWLPADPGIDRESRCQSEVSGAAQRARAAGLLRACGQLLVDGAGDLLAGRPEVVHPAAATGPWDSRRRPRGRRVRDSEQPLSAASLLHSLSDLLLGRSVDAGGWVPATGWHPAARSIAGALRPSLR